MIVTAYCLSYGHWTVISHQLAESFADMVDCGFNAVALSISESEMVYSRRAFEIQVDLAQKAGLKVFVIPSRVGGRFAGAPLSPSLWLSQHPEACVPDHIAFTGPIACLEHEPFREWMREFMTMLVSDYPIDGIIWDEPKDEQLISRHPDTLAVFGDNPTAEQMEDGFVDFLADLTCHCLDLRDDLTITLFNQLFSTERFTQATCAIPGIDYAGYDGNLCKQSMFHEEPEWRKYRIETAWDRTVDECASTGRKTFALIENMLMPASASDDYEANLDAYLASYKPDHLAIYYYAHNNEDPHRVHTITRAAMHKHL
jgi:hypothetical protein